MPLLVLPCTAVTWSAVGDPDTIRELLGDIKAIGKKRGHGEGHVLHWTVEKAPELDVFTAAHLHPDGTLGRPTPAGCLNGRRLVDGGESLAGLRPPYVHRSRQRTLRLPTA